MSIDSICGREKALYETLRSQVGIETAIEQYGRPAADAIALVSNEVRLDQRETKRRDGLGVFYG